MVSRCLLQRQLHGIVSLSCLSLSLLESLLFGVFFLDGGWTCVGGLILAFLASASSKWNADAVPSSWRVRFRAATVSATQRLAGRLVFARTLRRGGAANLQAGRADPEDTAHGGTTCLRRGRAGAGPPARSRRSEAARGPPS